MAQLTYDYIMNVLVSEFDYNTEKAEPIADLLYGMTKEINPCNGMKINNRRDLIEYITYYLE